MNITGILLAGGKSLRMGIEKGEIMLNGQELMKFPLKALESVCDHIMISTCNPAINNTEHQTVCDEIPGLGPLGGIYTCLKKTGTDTNVILSYDMPFVTADLLRHLLSLSNEFDITAPSLANQLPEPLCSVYQKSTTAAIEKSILNKNYKVNDLFKSTKFNHVVIHNQLPFFNPYLFYNVNKPGDYEEIRSIIQSQNFKPGNYHEGDTGE